MMTEDLIAQAGRTIMNTYNRYPICLVKGSGTRVWDSTGKEYLDLVAGIAVCSLGHSHPRVVEAVQRQAATLTHVSNLYFIEPQIAMAGMLVEHSFADKVFFCNSGAEANEAAIKLARKYAHEHMAGVRTELITMRNSFHGRTLATVTATGQEKFHQGFSPLPAGFSYVPYNDLDALEKAISARTYGVMLEPIQGEAGVIMPEEGYLRGLRQLCDERGILLIFDEVQVGMGRTGTLFAYEDYGIAPDIMTLAKALGNGFPVGAMLAGDEVARAFVPGAHASTFGGNPLAMAAACASMDVLLHGGVLENCRRVGTYFFSRLKELAASHAVIREVRGKGLILAVELTIPSGREATRACLEKGVLINCTNDNVLRFVPPLIITEGEVDEAIAVLDEVLAQS